MKQINIMINILISIDPMKESINKNIYIFFFCLFFLTIYPTSARLKAKLLYRLSNTVHRANANSVRPRIHNIITDNLLKNVNDDLFILSSTKSVILD
jgi:hypothetical protein